jgi:uncharacterized protein Yka (UPF0111/DUF47 family)
MKSLIHFFNRFLPANPDVLGMLVAQAEITVAGMTAFVAWAQGEPEADIAVRDAEHEADERKHTLRLALRDAFVTPIGAEDLFLMSARLDDVLGGAKDAVREAEVLDLVPDAASVTMVASLAEGTGHLLEAFACFTAGRPGLVQATEHAELAKKAARQLERDYRVAMKALLSSEDAREVTTRREMYRRFSRIADDLVEVAERVWYVSVKEA